jgi:hypothetical protein
MTNQGPINEPGLRSVLDAERQVAFSNLNKVQVGIIQSFNPAKQSVTVQLVIQRAVYNAPMEGSLVPPDPVIYPYPLLVDVPVFVLTGGSAYVAMPIAAGDPCVVLFNDRDLDPWWTNGTTGAPPNSARLHSLADGIALVGIRPATNPVPGIPSDGLHMAIGNASGTLRSALDALMDAEDSLLNALTGWINTDSTTPDPATVNALNSVKNSFDAVKTSLQSLFQ